MTKEEEGGRGAERHPLFSRVSKPSDSIDRGEGPQ